MCGGPTLTNLSLSGGSTAVTNSRWKIGVAVPMPICAFCIGVDSKVILTFGVRANFGGGPKTCLACVSYEFVVMIPNRSDTAVQLQMAFRVSSVSLSLCL
jgi:hypothetical protein